MVMRAGVAAADVLAEAPDLGDGTGSPAHLRIEQWLAGVIGRGRLVPGDRLPSEQDLAAVLGVSRMTLRQALASMEARGSIVRRRGRSGGTFVAEPRVECDLTGLVSFTEQMRRANKRPGARMVSTATRPASRAEASALGLRTGAALHEIVRVRSANREPLTLERACLPADLFPDLLVRPLTGSLYRVMARGYDLEPHTATEFLEPVVADAVQAELLGVAEGAPLLVVERTAFTAAGRAVEYSRDAFRPDRARIVVRARIEEQP